MPHYDPQTLNPDQRAAFDQILDAIHCPDASTKAYFLDGPGGTGKTYLYNCLISHLHSTTQKVSHLQNFFTIPFLQLFS
jgi:predicted ATPase